MSVGWSKEEVINYLLPMLCAHGVTSIEWEGLKMTLDPTLVAKSFKPVTLPDTSYDVNSVKVDPAPVEVVSP